MGRLKVQKMNTQLHRSWQRRADSEMEEYSYPIGAGMKKGGVLARR